MWNAPRPSSVVVALVLLACSGRVNAVPQQGAPYGNTTAPTVTRGPTLLSTSRSGSTARPTSAPPGGGNGSCEADCSWSMYQATGMWLPVNSWSTTLTAATVVTVFNNRTNSSRTTTIFNEMPESMRLETNEGGTRITTITPDRRNPSSTTVLTYPTRWGTYATAYEWEGILPTTSGTASICATVPTNKGNWSTVPFSIGPVSTVASIPRGGDAFGLNFQFIYAAENAYFETYQSLLPNEAAVQLCDPFPVLGTVYVQAVSYLTETASSFESSDPVTEGPQVGGSPPQAVTQEAPPAENATPMPLPSRPTAPPAPPSPPDQPPQLPATVPPANQPPALGQVLGPLLDIATNMPEAPVNAPPADNGPPSPGNGPPSIENSPPSTENSPPSTENSPPSSGNGPPSSGNGPPSSGNGPPSSQNVPASENGPPALGNVLGPLLAIGPTMLQPPVNAPSPANNPPAPAPLSSNNNPSQGSSPGANNVPSTGPAAEVGNTPPSSENAPGSAGNTPSSNNAVVGQPGSSNIQAPAVVPGDFGGTSTIAAGTVDSPEAGNTNPGSGNPPQSSGNTPASNNAVVGQPGNSNNQAPAVIPGADSGTSTVDVGTVDSPEAGDVILGSGGAPGSSGNAPASNNAVVGQTGNGDVQAPAVIPADVGGISTIVVGTVDTPSAAAERPGVDVNAPNNPPNNLPITLGGAGSSPVPIIGSGGANPVLITPVSGPAPSPAPLVLAGTTYTANAASAFVIAGQTLSPGAPITLNSGPDETVIAATTNDAGESLAVVSGPQGATSTIAFGGPVDTSGNAGAYVVAGQTLTPGGSITLNAGPSATVVALRTDAAGAPVVMVNDAGADNPPVSLRPFVLGGTTYSANSASAYVIAGQTLGFDGPITLGDGPSATTVALATDTAGVPIVVVNAGSTPRALTLGGQVFTGDTTGAFRIGSQTLAPGGSITLGSGPSSTVVALTTDVAGNTIVDVGGTSRATLGPLRTANQTSSATGRRTSTSGQTSSETRGPTETEGQTSPSPSQGAAAGRKLGSGLAGVWASMLLVLVGTVIIM